LSRRRMCWKSSPAISDCKANPDRASEETTTDPVKPQRGRGGRSLPWRQRLAQLGGAPEFEEAAAARGCGCTGKGFTSRGGGGGGVPGRAFISGSK
jgi:hypothetical protein